MSEGKIGVAISTTGETHRLNLLLRSVEAWCAIPSVHSVFVTVDGTHREAERVAEVLYDHTGSVYRVGQKIPFSSYRHSDTHRIGVAANKNTGLQLLMDQSRCEHLFLCDDDTWPLYTASLDKHINFEYEHSMVCWGKHRLDYEQASYAAWKWPRGVMLYQTRAVVEAVGGMDERFGVGGHEHAEYSQRIHNAGLTAEPFVTPASYATRNATGAAALWHCEDMPRLGEGLGAYRLRKRELTTIHRDASDWDRINAVMAEAEGSTAFVPYDSTYWSRASATLCTAPRA